MKGKGLTQHCEICNLPQQYKELNIKEFHYWTLGLHSDQYYLGRCVIMLNRHNEDFFDITDEEKEELFVIVRKLKSVTDELFHPDMYNYATLGNVVRHVHLHYIPRYSHPVVFENIPFTDEQWGKNYTPHPKGFTVPKDIMITMRNLIQEKFE